MTKTSNRAAIATAARKVALSAIAKAAYLADTSHAAMVATTAAFLGKAPTAEDKAAAKQRYAIGKLAAAIAAPLKLNATQGDKDFRADLRKGLPAKADADAILAFAEKLVCEFAGPAETANAKMPKGKTGRRTIAQQAKYRNAEKAFSLVLAETGHGAAQTIAGKNVKQKSRAPQMTGTRTIADHVNAMKPEHSQLVKPAPRMTPDEIHTYVETQAASLLACGNKYAKELDVAYGMAIQAFKSAINKAANDRAVRKATADAIKAENNKPAKGRKPKA